MGEAFTWQGGWRQTLECGASLRLWTHSNIAHMNFGLDFIIGAVQQGDFLTFQADFLLESGEFNLQNL